MKPEPVFCIMQNCVCGNKEIPLGDQKPTSLHGKIIVPPYCPRALAKFKERGVEVERRFSYRSRKGMSKE